MYGLSAILGSFVILKREEIKMELVTTILLFALGILLIIKGGDFFVDASTWIAERSGIPKLIIGATIVSMATTLPEVLVSVMAAAQEKVDTRPIQARQLQAPVCLPLPAGGGTPPQRSRGTPPAHGAYQAAQGPGLARPLSLRLHFCQRQRRESGNGESARLCRSLAPGVQTEHRLTAVR